MLQRNYYLQPKGIDSEICIVRMDSRINARKKYPARPCASGKPYLNILAATSLTYGSSRAHYDALSDNKSLAHPVGIRGGNN